MHRAVAGNPLSARKRTTLLEHVVPEASHDDVRDAAASILGRGISPMRWSRARDGARRWLRPERQNDVV